LRANVCANVSSNEAANAKLIKLPNMEAINETLAIAVFTVFIKLSRPILLSLSSCA
jgi:hypothetical protein